MGHHLHDDRRRNIGHNAERKDRHPRQCTATEHVEHVEDAATLLLKQQRHHSRIHPRNGDVCTDSKNDNGKQHEKNALPQLNGFTETAKPTQCVR